MVQLWPGRNFSGVLSPVQVAHNQELHRRLPHRAVALSLLVGGFHAKNALDTPWGSQIAEDALLNDE